MAATKTTRKTPLPGYIMAIVGFTVCAITPFVIPTGLHTQQSYNTLSTIAGVLFWAGLLVGILGCQVASGAVRPDPDYREARKQMRSCLLTFCSSVPAIIDLILFGVGLVITLAGYAVHLPGALAKTALFLTIWTFLLHFVLDGRPWRYMLHMLKKASGRSPERVTQAGPEALAEAADADSIGSKESVNNDTIESKTSETGDAQAEDTKGDNEQ